MKLSRQESLKMDKAAHREVMMEMEMYNVHKEKVYKSKKDYNRKDKNKEKKW